MRIALISDIHGNLAALEAVLADLESQPPDQVICLGDVALMGPQPAATIQRLIALGNPAILGNTDQWLLHPEKKPAATDEERNLQDVQLWALSQLGGAEEAYLGGLPEHLEVPLGDGRKLGCWHASPSGITVGLLPGSPDEALRSLLADVKADFVAAGHTHRAMWRTLDGTGLINPGSVGLALTQPGVYEPYAEYAVLNSEPGRLGVEFRRLPYDQVTYAQAVRKSGMPHPDWWLKRFKPAGSAEMDLPVSDD